MVRQGWLYYAGFACLLLGLGLEAGVGLINRANGHILLRTLRAGIEQPRWSGWECVRMRT